MERLQIRIDGMSCEGCVTSVQSALTSHDGVASAAADLETGMLAIEFDPAVIARPGIEAAIEEAGFEIA